MSLSDRLSQARKGRESELSTAEETVTPQRSTRKRSVDPYADIKKTVHAALVESLGPQLYHTQLSEHELNQRVRVVLHDVLTRDDTPLPSAERAALAQQIADEILGYGPLEPFLRDPEVTEVMVNGFDTVYIERCGQDRAGRRRLHRRRAPAPDDRQDRRPRRPPRGRVLPDGGRPPARRLARQRHRAAAGRGRVRADDPQVRHRPLHRRRPDRLRHADQGGGGVPRRVRAGQGQHPGRRRHRRRQDDDPQRAVELHPRGRAHRHDRGRRRAAAPPGPRDPPGVPPVEHRGPGRGHDPRPGQELPAHAPRPDRRRRGPRRRGPGHAPGDEHRPRRLHLHRARQHPARHPRPHRDHGADGRRGPARPGHPRAGLQRHRPRRAAGALQGRVAPHHAHHRGGGHGGRRHHHAGHLPASTTTPASTPRGTPWARWSPRACDPSSSRSWRRAACTSTPRCSPSTGPDHERPDDEMGGRRRRPQRRWAWARASPGPPPRGASSRSSPSTAR